MRDEKYNYGIGILKIIMCFEVVLCHFWSPNDIPFYLFPFWRLRYMAVPVFMIVSFYLCGCIFIGGSAEKLNTRMKRLAFPYFAWGIIYYVFLCVFQALTKSDRSVYLKDLVWQLFLGSSPVLIPPFWYQADLIFLTLLFWILLHMCKKKKEWQILIVWVLAICALFLQYSGINYAIFSRFGSEVKYPIGRIAEMIPLAAIGITLSNQKLMNLLCKNKILSTIIIMEIVVLSRFAVVEMEFSFAYGGLKIMAGALLIFLLVMFLPLDELPAVCKKSIQFLSRYSFGVFCMHFGIGGG